MNRLPLLRVILRPASLALFAAYFWLLLANGLALLKPMQLGPPLGASGLSFPEGFFTWFALGAVLGGTMIGLEVAQLLRTSFAWTLPGLRRALPWNLAALGLALGLLGAFATGPLDYGLLGVKSEAWLRFGATFFFFGAGVLWAQLRGRWLRLALGFLLLSGPLWGKEVFAVAFLRPVAAGFALLAAGGGTLALATTDARRRRLALEPGDSVLGPASPALASTTLPLRRGTGFAGRFLTAVEEVYGASGLRGFGALVKAALIIPSIAVLLYLLVPVGPGRLADRLAQAPDFFLTRAGSPLPPPALVTLLVLMILGFGLQVLVIKPGLHRPLSRRELFGLAFWGGLLWAVVRLALLAAGGLLVGLLAAAVAGISPLRMISPIFLRVLALAFAFTPLMQGLGWAQARHGAAWRATPSRRLIGILCLATYFGGATAALAWLPTAGAWPGGELGALAGLALLTWGGLYGTLRRAFLQGDLLRT